MSAERGSGGDGRAGEPPVCVLLVADGPSLESMVSHLESAAPSVEVCGVSSAATALDVVDDDRVDCVVSDYELAETSGLDLLEAVRERNPDLPFIIFTDRGNENVASEAISAGVTDYVRKPASGGYEVLAARIRAAVARRRVEAERDRQALAMETVEEGIAVVDADECFVEVNDAYAEMYGYDRDELVGTPWQRVNPPEENERMYLQILPALRDEGSWRGESVGRRKDGSTFAESKSLTLLDDGDFVCAVRDVTEQKATEQSLREQNERLREFARLVSHDLRNPLNVAEGYLALVEESAVDEQADGIERVRNAHDRMRRLIDDMLRLAREGRLVDNPEPVSVARVVEDAARTTGLDGTGVVDEALGSTEIYADEERLRALFENLLANAVEHAGPEPTVRVGPLEDAGGICGFFVEDDGPGIPEKRHVEVFKSGFTTESSGTGFGLAIVKRITNAHGWTVSVRNGSDGGARFEFRGVEVVTSGDGTEPSDGMEPSDGTDSGVAADGSGPD